MLVVGVSTEVRRVGFHLYKMFISHTDHTLNPLFVYVCMHGSVRVTCLFTLSSVTVSVWCGGGGGDLKITLASQTTGSDLASVTIIAGDLVRADCKPWFY